MRQPKLRAPVWSRRRHPGGTGRPLGAACRHRLALRRSPAPDDV